MEKSKAASKADTKRKRAQSEEEIPGNVNRNKKSSSSLRKARDASDDDSDSADEGSGHHEHMRQMDPFGSFGGGMLALPGPSRADQRRQQQQAQNMQVAEHSMFMNPFAHFDSMFSNMRSMMSDMHRAFDQVSTDPNAHVYQQQSFMSYSNTGTGAPRIYQASSSSRQGPGGIKETRKTVRDSESGVEKIAVGHHINDRGHVIERSQNRKTGEQVENQEYINIDEEEAQPFDQEYQEKWHSGMAMRGIDQRRRGDKSRHTSALTGDSPYHRTRHAALPEPPRNRKSSNKKE